MPDYKLFHLRTDLTSGSFFVGILYFLSAFAFGVFALRFNQYRVLIATFSEESSTATCGANLPFLLHLSIMSLIYLTMLVTFGVIAIWKIISLASFGLCPLFKYKLTTKVVGTNPS